MRTLGSITFQVKLEDRAASTGSEFFTEAWDRVGNILTRVRWAM